MAKFKVGDYVHIKGAGNDSRIYKIDKVEDKGSDGNPAYHVKDFPYAWFSEREVFANSCSSTNPVVQNALAAQGVARNADGAPESLVNWKRIYPKLKEFNSLAGWLKGEGVKLMNVARNFDDKKFHSVGHDVEGVCEWAERNSAEILNRV